MEWVKGWQTMSFKEDGRDIPTATGSAKKANLAKDEKIKGFWDKLVDDWLSRSKSPEKDESKE